MQGVSMTTTVSDNVKTVFSNRIVLILFLLSVPCSSELPAQGGEDPPVAIVNGTEIPYSAYDRARLTRLLNMGADPDDTAALDLLEDDGIFLTLVDSELLLQEARKQGLEVSRKEAIDMLVADPPDYLLAMFEGGKYDPKIMRKLATDPSTILQYARRPGVPKSKIVEDWEEDVDNLLRYYKVEESRRRLMEALYKEAPLTENDIRSRYFAENTVLAGSVVRVLHSTVADSLVPVTEGEARAWFNERREDYAIPESRLPLTIILPINPSSADSARQRGEIERVRKMIESVPPAQRDEKVRQALSDLPPNRIQEGKTISPVAFPNIVAQELAAAKPGDLVGPFPLEEEALMLYVVSESPSTDTIIRARHLLMKPVESEEGGESNLEGFLGFMRELRDSIDNEEEFIASAKYYSMDDISAQQGGDLGYAGRGLYVPEFDSALFAAPLGKAIGPVKTRFGYHLIWVNERIARDLQLRELRFPMHPSEEVVEKVRKDAEGYAAALRNGEPHETIIQEIARAYPSVVVDSMTYLKRLEPYADGLAIGEFLFRTDVGDVGVIPLPNDRVAVVKQLTYWPGGTPTYEEIPQYPTAHVRRKKQLDLLERRLSDLAPQITPTTLLGPIREHAPMAEILDISQRRIPVMEDEDPRLLDSLVAVTRPGEVGGPVRGVHALYFLRVTEWLGPDENAYRKEIAGFSEQYHRRYRQHLVEDLLKEARAEAEIKDMRNSTLMMLGASRP